jgi:hypothetical protein
LPQALLSELAQACAADSRIQVAYVFWMYVQLPGEVAHHCIGLSVEDHVSATDFEALIAAVWGRIAALAPSDVPIDFQRFTEAAPPSDSILPFFTRTT